MAGAWGRQVDPLASLHGAMHVPSNLPSSSLSSHLLVAEMSGWSSCSVSQHHARPARREGCGQGHHRGTMAERGGKSYSRAGWRVQSEAHLFEGIPSDVEVIAATAARRRGGGRGRGVGGERGIIITLGPDGSEDSGSGGDNRGGGRPRDREI